MLYFCLAVRGSLGSGGAGAGGSSVPLLVPPSGPPRWTSASFPSSQPIRGCSNTNTFSKTLKTQNFHFSRKCLTRRHCYSHLHTAGVPQYLRLGTFMGARGGTVAHHGAAPGPSCYCCHWRHPSAGKMAAGRHGACVATHRTPAATWVAAPGPTSQVPWRSGQGDQGLASRG